MSYKLESSLNHAIHASEERSRLGSVQYAHDEPGIEATGLSKHAGPQVAFVSAGGVRRSVVIKDPSGKEVDLRLAQSNGAPAPTVPTAAKTPTHRDPRRSAIRIESPAAKADREKRVQEEKERVEREARQNTQREEREVRALRDTEEKRHPQERERAERERQNEEVCAAAKAAVAAGASVEAEAKNKAGAGLEEGEIVEDERRQAPLSQDKDVDKNGPLDVSANQCKSLLQPRPSSLANVSFITDFDLIKYPEGITKPKIDVIVGGKGGAYRSVVCIDTTQI